jgi:benzoyl-CoA 2,3-dioxygenase component B
MLVRSSGSEEAPRMLGAFNEETPDWLSFFMFTYFTDRDGKMQLESLAQSGFDPLSRTCRFMITEEAHHMFVGETGVGRTIQATIEAMNAHGITDPYDINKVRDLGVIDLPTIQKKLNLHYSLSLDLFGQEVSTNAANAFNSGIKGRFMEQRIDDDHRLASDTYIVRTIKDSKVVAEEVPALTAINMRLRDDYVRDASGGVGRWNRMIAKAGVEFEMQLPDEAFHRQIGVFSEINSDTDGNLISRESWEEQKKNWLPTKSDGDYIQSLMKPCVKPGEYASWIATQIIVIYYKTCDFEYVKLHMD